MQYAVSERGVSQLDRRDGKAVVREAKYIHSICNLSIPPRVRA